MDGWTTPTVIAGAAALLAVLVAVALVVALVRLRRSTQDQLAAATALQAELVERLTALERPAPEAGPATPAAPVVEYVITEVGNEAAVAAEAPTRLEGRLFADVVLRETVVKAASWTYGVRSALSAENRNRIRFEVRRETKRSTKQRRADTKEALRQYYARQESSVTSQEST